MMRWQAAKSTAKEKLEEEAADRASNQIGHLDESLEPGVVLNVEAVEGDSSSEVRRRGVDEVADLVAVDVDGEDDVCGLGHELLAEVGADEATRADHADGEGRDGVAVQIHAGGRRRGRRHGIPVSLLSSSLPPLGAVGSGRMRAVAAAWCSGNVGGWVDDGLPGDVGGGGGGGLARLPFSPDSLSTSIYY